MKKPKPPSTTQSRALLNIDVVLDKLAVRGVPEADLRELRKVRELLCGAPLDRIKAEVDNAVIRDALWLAIFTGLLREDVLTLDWEHVNGAVGNFRVRHA
ncbi:MAG: hypothetical protein OXI87_23835 [Albidovulum sp.]|nr:hypothetical protein [Albidovulum sp.]